MLGALATNWIIGLLCVVAVVAVISFFIGWLFSKTSKLDLQLSNHYHTIKEKIEKMEGSVGTVENGMKEMKKEFVGLRSDIRGYFEGHGRENPPSGGT